MRFTTSKTTAGFSSELTVLLVAIVVVVSWTQQQQQHQVWGYSTSSVQMRRTTPSFATRPRSLSTTLVPSSSAVHNVLSHPKQQYPSSSSSLFSPLFRKPSSSLLYQSSEGNSNNNSDDSRLPSTSMFSAVKMLLRKMFAQLFTRTVLLQRWVRSFISSSFNSKSNPRISKASSPSWIRRTKRSMIMIFASLLIWFGASGIIGGGGGPSSGPPFTPPPAHASTTTVVASSSSSSSPTSFMSPVTSTVSSLTEGRSLDDIVDNYVQEYMFDDDVYDPVESIYREAMDDKLRGAYPKAIKEVTEEVFKGTEINRQNRIEKMKSDFDIGTIMSRSVNFLSDKIGLSETTATYILVAAIVSGAGSFMLFSVMAISEQNKRSVQKTMKERYGDDWTLDATIKEEPDVELDDDDDEDDDEEDDE